MRSGHSGNAAPLQGAGEPEPSTRPKPPRQPRLGWTDRVDAFSGVIGHLLGWLTVVMIVIGAFNAIARYSGRFIGMNLSSNAYLELQWYLFSAIFLLGASYSLSRGAHVRVDVLYTRMSRKRQAAVDLFGGVFFLLPFVLFALWLTWPPVQRSWALREVSPDPGGLPRYPIKALILLGFFLLFVQSLAEVAKAWRRLREPSRGTPNEEVLRAS